MSISAITRTFTSRHSHCRESLLLTADGKQNQIALRVLGLRNIFCTEEEGGSAFTLRTRRSRHGMLFLLAPAGQGGLSSFPASDANKKFVSCARIILLRNNYTPVLPYNADVSTPKSQKLNADPPRNLIGARMKLARQEAQPRVSQADLSARIHAYGVILNQASISKIEKGARIVTDIELKAIASALAVSVGWLIDEDETFATTRPRLSK